MTRRIQTCSAVVTCASALLLAQAAPDAWTITYAVSGGITGMSRRVTVTSGGRLKLDDRKVGRLDVPAPGDLNVRARDFVAAAREAERRPARTISPDRIGATLSLVSDGSTRNVEATPEIVNALMRAADVALWQSLVGTWRQTEWSPCTPAQPGAGDVGHAVEELALNGDSTFSVRWPGGPGSTSVPQVAVPDYTGAFRAVLTGGGIEFTPGDGAPVPGDFAGSGTFAFDGDRLLLRGIWFGARTTTRTADVCEIVFERK